VPAAGRTRETVTRERYRTGNSTDCPRRSEAERSRAKLARDTLCKRQTLVIGMDARWLYNTSLEPAWNLISCSLGPHCPLDSYP
jgi:hypothetical protein